MNHDYMAPEHLLLGFLKDKDDRGTDILTSLGVDLQKLWRDVAGQLVVGPDEVTTPSLVLPNSTKLVFERGVKEASGLRHQFFSVQHLLLGLIQDDGIAGQTLARFGVTLEAARAKTIRILTAGMPRRQNPEVNAPASSLLKPCEGEFDDGG